MKDFISLHDCTYEEIEALLKLALKLKDETVRVRISVSGVDIFADITLSALKDLNLELGKEVFISFKALSIATLKL